MRISPAKAALEAARSGHALLGCHNADIVFTGGGSEANNLALEEFFFALRAARGVAAPQELGLSLGRVEPDSIKSLEKFKRAWWERPRPHSPHRLPCCGRPSARMAARSGSSWNPRRKNDPVDALLRGSAPPTGAVSVKVNWKDNPLAPQDPGAGTRGIAFAITRTSTITSGKAVMPPAEALTSASSCDRKLEGRIGRGAFADPLLPLRAFFDLGGAGAPPTPWRSGSCNGSAGNQGPRLHRGHRPGARLLRQRTPSSRLWQGNLLSAIVSSRPSQDMSRCSLCPSGRPERAKGFLFSSSM